MADLRFFISDVFATVKYSGNQLATVLHDAKMPDDEMQQVAAEFGFSETTFIMGKEPVDGGYPVRIFTPKAEIPFAGHPTLGTAHILCKHVVERPVDRVTLNLGVGAITVTRVASDEARSTLWMRQNPPEFEHGMDLDIVASVIGLGREELDDRWPVSQVTTGLPFTIVPVKSMDSLKRTRVDLNRYEEWSQTVWAKGILVFCLGGYTERQDIAARVFVPYLGIPEDPATGSGNGCLAGYLVHHRCLESDSIDLCVGQGYEIGRKSEIFIRAQRSEETIQIDVGGRVIETAAGALTV
ncbi:PhzF family phenazine biosynthesis protein [Candidatus Bipolaricaulota bacterium]